MDDPNFPKNSKSFGNHTPISFVLICPLNLKVTQMKEFCLVSFSNLAGGTCIQPCTDPTERQTILERSCVVWKVSTTTGRIKGGLEDTANLIWPDLWWIACRGFRPELSQSLSGLCTSAQAMQTCVYLVQTMFSLCFGLVPWLILVVMDNQTQTEPFQKRRAFFRRAILWLVLCTVQIGSQSTAHTGQVSYQNHHCNARL